MGFLRPGQSVSEGKGSGGLWGVSLSQGHRSQGQLVGTPPLLVFWRVHLRSPLLAGRGRGREPLRWCDDFQS